jgi:hypothetical protein
MQKSPNSPFVKFEPLSETMSGIPKCEKTHLNFSIVEVEAMDFIGIASIHFE